MNRPLLQVEKRERTRKNALKVLREEGFIPGIIYGHNKESKNVQFYKREVDSVFKKYGIGSSVELKMENGVQHALIKDIQRHVTKQNVLHIDLQELDENIKIRVKIPLYLINKTTVESSTAVIQQQITELEIQTYPQYLPQSIEVDVSNMKFGEPLRVKDLPVINDENMEVLHELDEVIGLLTTTSKLEVVKEESQEDLLKKLY